MREFSTQVSGALQNGLRPNKSSQDSAFFDDLYNLVPYELGLRSYEEVASVIPEQLMRAKYPFPQWFRFQQDNIAVTNSRIYSLDDSYFPFDSGHVQTSEWGLGIFTETFQAVDYGKNWLLLNRDGAIYKRNGFVYSTDKLRASSILEFKNRTVIGGPLNGLWSQQWLDELAVLTNKSGISKEMFSMKLGRNYIFWSSFGSTDFPFALLHPKEFVEQEQLMDTLLENTWGFYELPFRGDVLNMQVLGNQLYVFCSDGLVSFTMDEAVGNTLRPTGQQAIGLKQRGAVGGDNTSLVFIDRFDQLWKATGEGLRKLDFSDYMSQLTGEIYISKNPDEELFYIGDQHRSFCLINQSLTRVFQTVGSVSGAYTGLSGVPFQTAGRHAGFKTDKIDIGMPSNKTLTGAFLSFNKYAPGSIAVSADVRGRKVKRPTARLNKEGYASTRLHGKNHQIEVKIDNFEDLLLDRIELKWQTDDNRQTRGLLTTEDATGTGE